MDVEGEDYYNKNFLGCSSQFADDNNAYALL